jgi:lipopolysaccharide/colanic/teichoic acid biosynthesis glycosyltransferase
LIKRIVEIVLSLIALPIILPLFIILAVLIYLQDGGPCFFSQDRIGKDGRIFRMWKFRSMVKNAESIGGYSTVDSDPRITFIGRFIRRTSLDELPQLFNVILGDMSLVGPRPDVPAQRSLYSDTDFVLRCSVRPGITGLAQALIRSTGSETDRLVLDLRYVREQSLKLDFLIMCWTVKRLSGKGAN